MTVGQNAISYEGVRGLIQAVEKIAHGGVEGGATGLEMLSIAVSGEGLAAPLGPAVEAGADRLAAAIDRHAEAVEQLAGALDRIGEALIRPDDQ